MSKDITYRLTHKFALVETAVYSIEEIAVILGKSVRFVRAACHRGDIKARRLHNGFVMTGRAVLAFVEGACVDFSPSAPPSGRSE